jgi:hypothetical protein
MGIALPFTGLYVSSPFMPVKVPHWFPWLSPLCAIGGAWLIGVWAMQGGFWVILGVAIVCAVLPFIVFRIACRLRNTGSGEHLNG